MHAALPSFSKYIGKNITRRAEYKVSASQSHSEMNLQLPKELS